MGGLGHRESEVGPGGLGEKLPLPANLAMGKNCASLLDNAPNYLPSWVCYTKEISSAKNYCPKINLCTYSYIYCPFSFTDLGRSREDIDKHRDLDKESMLSLSASGLGKPDLANYVPNQRLEWKRYKQYTRNDIMAAIEEVKSGMKFFFLY